MRSLILAATMLIATSSAYADPYAHPAADQPDPYRGIRNFDGMLCCSGNDCRADRYGAEFKPEANGYTIRSTGEFVPMKDTGFSPNNAWHICRRSDIKKTIRCLLVPAGGA